MTEQISSAEGLDEALAALGVQPVRVVDIEAGRVNRHWLVEAEIGRTVLRRYRLSRSERSIAFEHELLRHVLGKGWPVAPPLQADDGGTVVRAGGSLWSLFPFLPGEPVPYEALPMKGVKGRLLARLHGDMADFPITTQRSGCGRIWELDVFAQAGGHDSFNQLLRRFEREYPEMAAVVRREKYRSLRELSRLGYGETPAVIIHRDFHHDNLLFEGGELTGLLDFDLSCWDAAVCDVAASLTLECLAAPDYDSIDLKMARAFLDGYAEQRRLSVEEARLIPPLVRANYLWMVMFRLLQWADSGSERAVASVRRSVERRFPGLSGQWSELAAVCEGVGV
jgi:homoserine kinase type II